MKGNIDFYEHVSNYSKPFESQFSDYNKPCVMSVLQVSAMLSEMKYNILLDIIRFHLDGPENLTVDISIQELHRYPDGALEIEIVNVLSQKIPDIWLCSKLTITR